MSHKYSELEVKYFAPKVLPVDFRTWAMGHNPSEYRRVEGGIDDYWEHNTGVGVIRHRHGPGKNELTVKIRKSPYSTFDRTEIDLPIDPKYKEDIGEFLRCTGYHVAFSVKKWADLFEFEGVSVCMYEAIAERPGRSRPVTEYDGKPTVFIEVEATKDTTTCRATDASNIELWASKIRSQFGITQQDLCNKSLYEMFSLSYKQ